MLEAGDFLVANTCHRVGENRSDVLTEVEVPSLGTPLLVDLPLLVPVKRKQVEAADKRLPIWLLDAYGKLLAPFTKRGIFDPLLAFWASGESLLLRESAVMTNEIVVGLVVVRKKLDKSFL